MKKKSITLTVILICTLTIIFTLVGCTDKDSAETATISAVTTIKETVPSTTSNVSETRESSPTKKYSDSHESSSIEESQAEVKTSTAVYSIEKSQTEEETSTVDYSIEENILNEVDDNSAPTPVYARCIVDTTVISDYEYSLYRGELVYVLEYVDDTTAVIEWYHSTATVSLDTLSIYPEGYTPNFESDSFAGCITN